MLIWLNMKQYTTQAEFIKDIINHGAKIDISREGGAEFWVWDTKLLFRNNKIA